MAAFDVRQWVQQYQRGGSSKVTMSRPEQVSCWTKHGDEFGFGDASGLPTYSRPQLPVDLNQGWPDSYTPKPQGQASPVTTIAQAAQQAGVDWSHFDVCTYRNNMNKVLGTLQAHDANKDSWEMECCLHSASGTLFLDIVPGPPATFPDADKFTFYGYKFEAVCTGSSTVDASSEYAILVTYQLGRVRLLMAAEIDAQQPGGAPGPEGGQPYVEMKTYTLPRHAKAVAGMYRDKHPRWWVQSYLAGVPTLVLGGRDISGQLVKVQEVPVQALPGMSAQAGHSWDPQQMLAFGEAFLVWLREVASKHPDQLLRVMYDHSSRAIHCEAIEGSLPAQLAEVVSSAGQ